MSSDADFDYVQVVLYDIHCRPMAKLVNRRRLRAAYKGGVGMFGGILFFGIDWQPPLHPDFGSNVGFSNLFVKPIEATLTPSHEGKGRVGHVVCDLVDLDGNPLSFSPRTAAQIQLSRLQELGLSMQSSSEIEFDIKDPQTGQYFGHTDQWASLQVIDVNQELLIDFLDQLTLVGVRVDSMQTEEGPGMFELTYDVAPGIKGPDSTARFKSLAKSFFKKKGLAATFMTKSDRGGVSSGMHFNHSLWTDDGKNAFMDEKQPFKCSVLCRQWIAGLVKHAASITALCCPTVNCYRRIGGAWAPKDATWGYSDRGVCFRLKCEGKNVYVENRLPSGASNPYLVMAATIAAGLDGVKNKLELGDNPATPELLPTDLESAIRLLESDDVIVKAVGPELVKYFAYCKRTFELEPLKELEGAEDEIKFKKEYEMYFDEA